MISLEEAKKRQDELQAEGRELLRQRDIEGRLEHLGQLHIDGSFKYGLMVKPDIDMHIYVENLDVRPLAEIAKNLLLDGATRVHVSNKQDLLPPSAGKPRGIYLGFRYFFGDKEWNFDVWVLQPKDELDNDNFAPGWHDKLTHRQRDTILFLKWNLKEQGRYPGIGEGKFASADIYRAVMNDGVKTIAELDEWRKTHPYY